MKPSRNFSNASSGNKNLWESILVWDQYVSGVALLINFNQNRNIKSKFCEFRLVNWSKFFQLS